MLLTNRRHRVLFVALAGMEMAWFAPFAALLLADWSRRVDRAWLATLEAAPTADALAALQTTPGWGLFWVLFGGMLLYMLAADLLNQRQIGSPQRDLVMLAIVLTTSLLAIRGLLYGTAAPADLRFLPNTMNGVFNFTAGRRPEVVILLLNAFIWFRVAMMTDRSLAFFDVGLSFRLGLLFAIAGGAVLTITAQRPTTEALTYFALFLFWGLLAVSIARLDEKALLVENSRGALLTWPRLGQVVLIVLATLSAIAGLSHIYTPSTLRAVIAWFDPLWRVLGQMAVYLLYGILWLVMPLLNRFAQFIAWALSQFDPPSQQEQPPVAVGGPFEPSDITALLDRSPTLRFGLVTAIIVLVLGLIWLFFLRTRQRDRRDEEEASGQDAFTFGGGLLARGVDRLRDLLDLVRRYGLSSQLLAAISIQNIYANVGRLARRRGFPRPPSLPPDDYLPLLCAAFPGYDDELAAITGAYMRVEYGDMLLDEAESSALRTAYQRLRQAPPLEATATPPSAT